MFEHVICENASSFTPIREVHYADSMLYILVPEASVATPVSPDHLADALSLVI